MTVKTIIFIIFLLTSKLFIAQDIRGKWKTDKLIGLDDEIEYILFPIKINEHKYGNLLDLNLDGTFINSYSAKCGNDCFGTTIGQYELVDTNHIGIKLQRIKKYGDCPKVDEQLNKDLGLFYIHHDTATIKLFKSDGNLINDKKNIVYSSLVDSFTYKVNDKYNRYYFKWKESKGENVNDVIKEYFSDEQTIKKENVTVLYYKETGGYYYSILIVVDNKFHFMFYDFLHKDIALYYPSGY